MKSEPLSKGDKESDQMNIEMIVKQEKKIIELEMSGTRKDIEIDNLTKELRRIKQSIEMKVEETVKERANRNSSEHSIISLSFIAENSDLKRQNGELKLDNTKLKKALKDTKFKLETLQTQNSSLNYKINEYTNLEKLKWEDNTNSGEDSKNVIKVSQDRGLLGNPLLYILFPVSMPFTHDHM